LTSRTSLYIFRKDKEYVRGIEMYARITTAYLRKDLIDKAIKVFEDSIVPAAKKQEGFKSLTVFVDRDSGKSIVVSSWESQDNIEVNEQNQYYQEQLMKLMVTFTADPMRESFEVVVQA
jgi:quinol monooxygenase YgiN